MIELFELMDDAFADELGVDLETYIDVIENKCTLEEADFIIDQLFNEGDIDAAKEMFNSKLKNELNEDNQWCYYSGMPSPNAYIKNNEQ
jgi:hypothetical protein